MSIEYDKLEKIVVLFWDSEENFKLERTQQKLGSLFKEIHLINSKDKLKEIFELYNLGQQFLCFVHLSHSKGNKGYYDFINSKVLRDYPNLRYYLITSALKNEVYNEKNESLDVFTYDGYQEKIFKTFIPQTKAEIEGSTYEIETNQMISVKVVNQNIDYVIMTALEDDEMETVLPMIMKTGKIENTKHLIEYGHLKSDPNKRVAYASQLSTGMVDAAILATELINCFQPKFLIMAGVLGGKPDEVAIGDIVVATKVFTIDKGKLAQNGFKKEIEASNTDNAFITGFKRKKEDIVQFIKTSDPTRKKLVDVHFGAIACVRHVIDSEGFFNNEITTVDRKAIALEMESYGVSRACELANNGKTMALIIKSVMDNTTQKVDEAKRYAAWTSATFVKFIMENDLI